MGLKKNSPGCGCCETGCDTDCGDGTSASITQVTFNLDAVLNDATLGDYMDFYSDEVVTIGGVGDFHYLRRIRIWGWPGSESFIFTRTAPACEWSSQSSISVDWDFHEWLLTSNCTIDSLNYTESGTVDLNITGPTVVSSSYELLINTDDIIIKDGQPGERNFGGQALQYSVFSGGASNPCGTTDLRATAPTTYQDDGSGDCEFPSQTFTADAEAA